MNKKVFDNIGVKKRRESSVKRAKKEGKKVDGLEQAHTRYQMNLEAPRLCGRCR